MLGDRVDHAPFGVSGGKSAAPNEVEVPHRRQGVDPADAQQGREPVRSRPATASCVSSPGGGGFGDPLRARLSTRSSATSTSGYISRETAERDYGVVMADETSHVGRSRFIVDRQASLVERLKRAHDLEHAQHQHVHPHAHSHDDAGHRESDPGKARA